MTDLYIGVGLLVAASVTAGLGMQRVSRKWSRRWRIAILVLALAAMPVYAALWIDSVWWARLLPFSNVLVLANLLPIFAGTVAPLCWQLAPGKAWRRALVAAAIPAISLFTVIHQVAGGARSGRDAWVGDVCIQTSETTCSAACAATTLRAHGIAATEQEMIELCRTGPRGTTTLGLYRGLKLKTKGTDFRVEVVLDDMESLREASDAAPMVLVVGLPARGADDPRFEQDWGWRRGTSHAVVLFGFTDDGRVKMGDPSIGREHWRVEGVRVLWRGEAFALRRRE